MRIYREVIISEHKGVEAVFGHRGEEVHAPTAVEHGRLLKDKGNHRLDVGHRVGLSMELSLLSGLVLGDVLFGRLGPCSSGVRSSISRLGLDGGSFGSSDGLGGRLLELGVRTHDGQSRRRSPTGRGRDASGSPMVYRKRKLKDRDPTDTILEK
jgi:hypothetical protein